MLPSRRPAPDPSVRIELDPEVPGGGADGRQDRLIRGRVTTGLVVTAIELLFRNEVVGRIAYAPATDQTRELDNRTAKPFHFNLNFMRDADATEFTIDVQDAAGRLHRETFELALEADDDGAGRIVDGPVGDPAELATMTAPVFVYVERAEFGGMATIEGWAAGLNGPVSVQVLIAGRPAGDVRLTGHRPQIAETFPDYRSGGVRGFAWSGVVDEAARITVLAASADGGSHEISVPRIRPPPQIEPPGLPAGAFTFHIDSPALANGAAVSRVSGRLNIQGWVIGSSAIARIEVRMDGARLGTAYHGLVRQDVAAAFPQHPGALHAGFAFHCPPRALKPGNHAIELLVTARCGQSQVIVFTIEVAPSDAARPHATVRRRLSPTETEILSGIVAALGGPGTFHLVLRQQGTMDARLLRATLHSLRDQVHGDWRLHVAAGDRDILAGIAATEPDIAGRIDLDQGCNPEVLSPTALIGVVQPGDVLGCDALLEFSVMAGKHPQADFFYADDCRRSPAGGGEPFFKPDWSPDLLLSTNYIGRAWFASAALLARAGISLGDLATAGDFDLVLRATEQAAEIRHVQRLLWLNADAAEGAKEQRAALTAAASRRGLEGAIIPGLAAGTWRLRRAIPMPERVSIVIPTRGTAGHIRACIDSLRALTTYPDYEIVVIDNIPPEDAACRRYVADAADHVVEIPGAFNWSRFNNLAAAACTGKFLLFLNDDTEIVEPGWLEALVEHGQRPEVGAVGARLLYPNRTVQHAGMFLSQPGVARHAFRHLATDEPGYFGLAQTPRNVIAVTGACLLVRRDLFDRFEGFDEAHAIVAGDLDFCLRVHAAGLLTVFTPYATLIHHEFASRDRLAERFDVERFERRWSTLFAAGDPFFSPHLDRHADDYAPDDEPVVAKFATHPLFRRAEIKTILVVKLDHIGDFIMAIPAIAQLRALFPGARLCLLANPGLAALSATVPEIDLFIPFGFFHARSELGRREVTPEQLADLRSGLAAHRFDLAIDLRKQPDTREMLPLAGARFLAGFDHRGQFPFLDVALEWEGDTAMQGKRAPIGDDLVNLVRAVETASEPRRPSIHTCPKTAPDFVSGKTRLLWTRPVVAVHPGVGNELRRWPAEKFAAVINLLTERNAVGVVLIGAADEAETAAQVLAQVIDRTSVGSLVGLTKLRDLPVLLRSCALYIGNNSGPKHIAASLGVPTIGVHSGVVDATEWGPVGDRAVALTRDMACSPCYLNHLADCPRFYACMRQLEPALVHQMAETFLGRPVG